MAGATIRELCQSHRIAGKSRSMTVETPTHVHHLWVFGNIYLAHIAMASFAVQACRDMGTMGEMDKVWHLRDWHPGDLFMI